MMDAKEDKENKERKDIGIKSNDTNNKERIKTTKVTDEYNLGNYTEEGYSTARFISKLLSFVGWAVVVIGVILALFSVVTSKNLLLILPGLYISLGGLFSVALGQIMRATVDNASHTKEIAKNSKEMLELKVLEIEKKYKKI